MYADLCKCYVHTAVDEISTNSVYVRYCVHTEPPKQTPSCAEFERQNRGY